MKILDVGPITDLAEMPVKKGTLQFLQDAHKENIAALIQGIIGSGYNSSTIYILNGVINSLTPPNYNISSGMVFYNGEIFLVDAVAFVAGGSNVGVFSIVVTQYTTDADPVMFTDSTTHNVHNIRKMTISAGATGSGIADFSSAQNINLIIYPLLQAPVSAPYADNIAQIVSLGGIQYGVYVPGNANLNPVVAAGEVSVGDVSPGGGTTITITFGTPLADANYYVIGSLYSVGTPSLDATVAFAVIESSITASGFQIHLQEFAAIVQALKFVYVCHHK